MLRMVKWMLGWVLFIGLLYALSGGVTVNGKHYTVSCDDDNGVVFRGPELDASTGDAHR